MNDDSQKPQDDQPTTPVPAVPAVDSKTWYQQFGTSQPAPASADEAVVPPVSSVGSVQKEGAPLVEVMQPVEHMPRLSPEMEAIGVEVPPETVQLDVSQIQAGLSHAGADAAHPINPSGMIKLPMSEEEAVVIKKERPITDAAKWLAEYVLRQYKLIQKGVVKS